MIKLPLNWHYVYLDKPFVQISVGDVYLWVYKQQMTTTNSNVCTPCLPTAICVDLRSNVYHVGGWNCPKSMHKSKCTYILVFSNLGNTSKRTNSKYGIRVQYYGHASAGQWTLTNPRRGIWTPVLEIQIQTCLFFNLYMCIYFNPRATSIPWSNFRKQDIQ